MIRRLPFPLFIMLLPATAAYVRRLALMIGQNGAATEDKISTANCITLPGATGPMEFNDRGLHSLPGNNLALAFTSLTSATDGVQFCDGTGSICVPVTDANGCDMTVGKIRMAFIDTHTTLGAYRLHFRTKVI